MKGKIYKTKNQNHELNNKKFNKIKLIIILNQKKQKRNIKNIQIKPKNIINENIERLFEINEKS